MASIRIALAVGWRARKRGKYDEGREKERGNACLKFPCVSFCSLHDKEGLEL